MVGAEGLIGQTEETNLLSQVHVDKAKFNRFPKFVNIRWRPLRLSMLGGVGSFTDLHIHRSDVASFRFRADYRGSFLAFQSS